MKGSKTLTVVDSKNSIVPKGTTLTVHKDHTNQFTERRVLTVSADTEIPNLLDGSKFQLYQTPDVSVWTEIHVGLSRDHAKVTLK